KVRRRNDISAFALNGLDHYCRDLVGMDGGFEYDLLYIGRVAKRNVRNARDERTESFPLNRFRGSERQRTHRAAVKRGMKRDELPAACRVTRELHRSFNRFSAGVSEKAAP